MKVSLRLLLVPFLFVFFFAVTGVKAQDIVQTNIAPAAMTTVQTDQTLIEVVDSSGNKVLRGNFSNSEGGDFRVDLENTGYVAQPVSAPVSAPISPCAKTVGCNPCNTGCNSCQTSCNDPNGYAKVDNVRHKCSCERRIKVKVKDLNGCSDYTVLVNGVSAGSITTNKHGDGELKLEPEQLNFQGQQAQIEPQVQ